MSRARYMHACFACVFTHEKPRFMHAKGRACHMAFEGVFSNAFRIPFSILPQGSLK